MVNFSAFILDHFSTFVDTVGYIDTVAPKLAAFYSTKSRFEDGEYSGPSLLWSTTLTACCAAVIAQLHKIGSPYHPLMICHDRMTLSSSQKRNLRNVVEDLVPSIMREISAGITGRTLPDPDRLPQVTLCTGERCFRPGLAFADFFVSIARSAWLRGVAAPAVPGIIPAMDLTSAATANLGDDWDPPLRTEE